MVIKFANTSNVKYTIEYFHSRVKNDIENWPDGILADYARLVELLMEFGPNLRMPHSRAMGGGPFELRPRGREGIGRALYCFVVGQRIVMFHAFVK
jgi:phage-related protein